MRPLSKRVLHSAASAALLPVRAARRLAGEPYTFEGKAVLITGARGLALVLARQLAEQGAQLALVARDEAELVRAADELRAHDGVVYTYVADLRDAAQAGAAVRAVRARYGRLDVLVNCAGVIQGGPLEHMSLEDYEEAMAIHFWAPLYTMQAALPYLKEQREGRIANISSVGGLVAVPHLAPYSASKFALTGLSDAWRDELAKEGIKVTTICPGLMRTGSQYNTGIKGQHKKELALFAMILSSPLTSVDARRAARQIVRAIRRGDARLVISVQARLLALSDALFPELTADVKALAVRFLPGPVGPAGDQLQSGWQSRSALAPSFFTRWIDEAAVRNNELGEREVTEVLGGRETI